MQAKHIISILLLLMVVLGIFNIPEKTSSEKKKQINHPTVFVHGYKGTHNSFGNMLDRFEHMYGWGQTALVYEVSPTGNLDVYQLNNGQSAEPMYVQVIFENNRAGIQDTSEWLAKLMAHMKETYQVNSANLVGHSMGGLVSMHYIENYQDYSTYPKVKKIAAIGSPFNGIYSDAYFQIHHDPAAEDLKPDSFALNSLRLNKDAIPDDLKVLSIGSTGDSVALPESVEMIRNIVDEKQLTYKMIEDPALGHSALHEDSRIDQMIYSFLQYEKAERTEKD
ncbi:alpha/beta fold hydrolase [Lentibacillus sp. CBA3610]|uniref:alpha/beta fold hydrolase n=1 Tax=Lentibacillus sp. CBA3610 TaxID=2518176 RepID=UPI001594F9F2|nr:alpha/beta fold hydrolase [Lentibacillus sp. CBA3610]QKY71152.1 alpha/beta fold hydrolase [Lentibacillus sp. CBA3610]